MLDSFIAIGVVVLTALGIGIILLIRANRIDPKLFDLMLNRIDFLEKGQERIERATRDEIAKNREESLSQGKNLREEVSGSLKSFGEVIARSMADNAGLQKEQLTEVSSRIVQLTESNDIKQENLRKVVEDRLRLLQEDNSAKLDQMRQTVDEKLQGTLDKRLGESFRQVSERLEQVHKGLGEMQTLASGVGDLKKVLTNVKTRGTWGEVQLGGLLDLILSHDQYSSNVKTKEGSDERVEYAIRLPGQDSDKSEVLLPIDAKCPLEDYQRLVEASESGNAEGVEAAAKQLEQRIKSCAKDIRDKYLNPPRTTDFAIMYLPTEGLFSEVLRRTGLTDLLQREYRVTVAGPTTLAAILNSLQMGFKTLAIQKRSSEVWQVLGAVKTEFGRFGDVLQKVQKKLNEASKTIDDATTRQRVIDRKLREVEALPSSEAQALLGHPEEPSPVETPVED